jgi:hypothetical protein
MYKRTFKTLILALGLGVAIPVQAALGMPTDNTGGRVVVAQPSTVLTSEKLVGLNLQAQGSAAIVSEKTAGLNLSTPQLSTPQSSGPVVSEKTAGLNVPATALPEPVLVSAGDGFDWSDAGVGGAVVFGSLLAALAAAGAVRHRHAHLAH